MSEQSIYAVMNQPTNQFVELDIAKHVNYVPLPSKNAVVINVEAAVEMRDLLMQQFDVVLRHIDYEIRELSDVSEEIGRWGMDPKTFNDMAKEQLNRLILRQERVLKQRDEADFVVVELIYRVVDTSQMAPTRTWASDMMCPFPEDGFSTKICTSPDSKKEDCKK